MRPRAAAAAAAATAAGGGGSAGGGGPARLISLGSSAGTAAEVAAAAAADEGSSNAEARFVEADLAAVAGLIGLQSITSTLEHAGSRRLFLFEQLTHLDRCVAPTAELKDQSQDHSTQTGFICCCT